MEDDGSRNTNIKKEDVDNLNPDWDGSEAGFVEDTDAKEYTEEYSGIRLSYKLTKKEIYESVKRAGYYKINRVKTIVETVALSVAFIIFFASYFIYGNTVNIVMSIICVLVLGAIFFIPRYIINKQVETQKEKTKEMTIDIYPDEIEVNKGKNGWELQLDSTTEMEEYDDMVILYLPDTHILIIPIRVIEPNVIGEVLSILKAGTKKREERIIIRHK